MTVYQKQFLNKDEADTMVRQLWNNGLKTIADGKTVWVEWSEGTLDSGWTRSDWAAIPGPGFMPIGDQAYYDGVFFGHFGTVQMDDQSFYFSTTHLIVHGEDWQWDVINKRWWMGKTTSVLARD
jgi:hypothetical protein